MECRPATPSELPTARTICVMAQLQVPRNACRYGLTLIAIDDSRILGSLILNGNEILAVAVRPNRRNQGIGSSLVSTARLYRPRLIAVFDPTVRPFYEAIGFEIPADSTQKYRTITRKYSVREDQIIGLLST